MRVLLACVLFAVAACGDNISNDISIVTKPVVIPPGTEKVICYFLHTDNADDTVINKWVSDVTPGIHHLILFRNPSGLQDEDHTSVENCGLIGTSAPVYTFASAKLQETVEFPTDDGAGLPLGQTVPGKSAMFLQLHYLNTTDSDMTVQARVNGYAMPHGIEHTETQSYMVYNNSIRIPPNAVNHTETAKCPTPTGAKFWTLQTHAHQQSLHSEVLNANTEMIYQNDDWTNPKVDYPDPFITFPNDEMTWSCTYNNTGPNKNSMIFSGPSATINEMCVTMTYYFPATKAIPCIYDTTIPEQCHCI